MTPSLRMILLLSLLIGMAMKLRETAPAYYLGATQHVPGCGRMRTVMA